MVGVGEKERAPITLKPLYEVHCGGSVGAPFSGCYLCTDFSNFRIPPFLFLRHRFVRLTGRKVEPDGRTKSTGYSLPRTTQSKGPMSHCTTLSRSLLKYADVSFFLQEIGEDDKLRPRMIINQRMK